MKKGLFLSKQQYKAQKGTAQHKADRDTIIKRFLDNPPNWDLVLKLDKTY